MPIKDSELKGPKTPPLSIDGRIPVPNSDLPQYDDLSEDNAKRDPTPCNQRTARDYRETRPTAKDGVKAFYNRQLGIAPGPNKL